MRRPVDPNRMFLLVGLVQFGPKQQLLSGSPDAVGRGVMVIAGTHSGFVRSFDADAIGVRSTGFSASRSTARSVRFTVQVLAQLEFRRAVGGVIRTPATASAVKASMMFAGSC